MYKIEISLKSHQPLSLKRGVKSLQQLIREKEKILLSRRILKARAEKARTLGQGFGLFTMSNQRFSGSETEIRKVEKAANEIPIFSSNPLSQQWNPSWLTSPAPDSNRLWKKKGKKQEESLLFQSCHSVSLPRLKKKWTVLRSPHIDKKSREQFEWTRCKEKIHIFSTQRKITLYLLSILRHSEIPGVELGLQLNFLTYFKRAEGKVI
jgi:hypothetical protein